MLDFLAPIGRYISSYNVEVSIAFIACFLVITGNDINRILRKVMRGQHFIVRTCAFILLNAFGYGLIIVKASPFLANWMNSLEAGILCITVISGFVVIGAWAQKNRHV